MEPIRKRITIQTTSGTARIYATCLGCFGVIHEYHKSDSRAKRKQRPFTIIHLPTGLNFGKGHIFDTEEAALAFIREVSTIRDWTAPRVDEYQGAQLRKKVEALYSICGANPTRNRGYHGSSPARPINTHALRPCNLEE